MDRRLIAYFATVVVLLLAGLAGCVPNQPPVLPTPEPQATPIQGEGELRAFMGETEITGQVLDAGGTLHEYVRGDHVTVYMHVPNDKLSDDAGVLRLRPTLAQQLFEQGGFGRFVRGQAVIGLTTGNDYWPGWCEWEGAEFIVFRYLDYVGSAQGSNQLPVLGRTTGSDQPGSWHNGPEFGCTIQIP